jgi:enediyne biosynthesis protein E7
LILQVKCQAEIDEIYAKFDLDEESCVPYEAIAELEYLSAVIKEGLRLHPPASSLGRATTEDVILPPIDKDGENREGYHLRAGTIMITMIASLHRHPDFWTNPDIFDPDRFLKENIR